MVLVFLLDFDCCIFSILLVGSGTEPHQLRLNAS